MVDKQKNLMYNKSNLIDDILVTNVLIGKTVKAVTAPATVKGDEIQCHCYKWEGVFHMTRKSGDLPMFVYCYFGRN